MPSTPARLTLRALLFLLLPLAACSGSDDDAGDGALDAAVVTPETVIVAAPPAITNQPVVHVELASDPAGATFQCSLDGRPSTACEAAFDLTVGDGDHRLLVTAQLAGVSDPTPPIIAWTSDTVAPRTQIDQAPAAIDNSTSPRFEFKATGGEAVTFTCALDGGEPGACESPWQTPALGEGPHRVEIAATDLAGNVERPGRDHSWLLDLAPPDTTIDTGPDSQIASRDTTFTFSSPDAAAGSAFLCAIDAAAWSPCTSPLAVTVPFDGPHSFQVQVREPLGPVDPSPALHIWSVDTVAPELTVEALPAISNDPTPTLHFTTSGASATECRARSTDTFVACASPYTAAPLPEGVQTLEVRARDAAGNQTLVQRQVTIDTTPPVIAFSGGPDVATNDTTPTLAWTATGATVVNCIVNNGWGVACASPYTIPVVLSQGNHTFSVYARDAAGNSVTVSRTFTVDTTAPFPWFSGGPNGATADNTPTFEFGAADAGAFTCRVGVLTNPFLPCSSPLTLAAMPDGPSAITVRITDAAGNVGETAPHGFTVDTRPLAVTFTGGPTGFTNDRTPEFTWSNVGAVSYSRCRYDADVFAACTTTMGLSLTDGPHTFEVRIFDDLNHDTSATRSFTVDTVAPGVTFTGGPTGTIPTADVSFTFDTSGDPAVTECRLYRQNMATGPYLPCTSPHAESLAPPSAPYPYTFEVRVRDAAGNQWSGYRNFTYAP